MATITFENVSKKFGSNEVLKNLSLVVQDGECFTLLGPSGCGKTVLLRLLAGFDVPDSGRILIDDVVVADPATNTDIPPDQRGLGVVFQDYACWPHVCLLLESAFSCSLPIFLSCHQLCKDKCRHCCQSNCPSKALGTDDE